MKVADTVLGVGIVLVVMAILIELFRSVYTHYCIRKGADYQKEIGRYFVALKEGNAGIEKLQKELLQIKKITKYLERHTMSDEDVQFNKYPLHNTVLFDTLDDYKNQAEQMHITYSQQVDKTVVFPCNELDTVTLLGNLLDNAIEACVAYKESISASHIRITLETFLKGERVAVRLVLENSKNPAAHPVERGFATTKTDSKRHGKGMTIIKEIVKKYDGYLFFVDEGERFVTGIEFWEEEERV